MESYFTAIQPHLEDRVDIALISNNETTASKAIISLGIDNLIFVRDLTSNQEERIQLPSDTNYHCIAKGLTPRKCILGSQNGTVQEFDMQTKQSKPIYKTQFKINSLANSPNNRLLAVGSEESKCILIDLLTFRYSKCRPGHEEGVANATFSFDQKYLASIGKDRSLLIYSIQNFQQPLQMYRYKICKNDQTNAMTLNGCFHKVLPIFYSPGNTNLQRIQLLNNKWEHQISSFVKHQNIITLVKVIKTHILITSTQDEFFIWNNKTQQKIVVIENFNLQKIIEVNQTFWGCRNNGSIYCYSKVLNESIFGGQAAQEQIEQMEIQPNFKPLDINNKDVINFDDDEEGSSQQQSKDNEIQQKEYNKYQDKNKSKVDKIVTAFPQKPVINSTPFFQAQNSRYIHTSNYGYLIATRQNELETKIQFQSEDQKKNQLIFVNKQILFADFNSLFVAYANQTSFGVKFLSRFADFDSWQKNWWEIYSIACSYNWIAVANEQHIRILDITGNQIKNIAFDRSIIAMAAYENILALVYHESIPIQGSQCLAMQLYVINSQKNQALRCSSCHVPVKPKSQLKFFRFTNEGMLLSHDTEGNIKVYNLENNCWTSVFIEGIEDTRRLWLLGMQNYQIIYWKSSQLNPEPQVFPRLPVKQSRVGVICGVDDSQIMSEYPFLLFQRFSLDHEKCRSRLWNHLKVIRKQNQGGYDQIRSILNEKQLMKHHNQLDIKLFDMIKYYIKSKMLSKAVMAAKSLIRTIQAGKQLINIFDELHQRASAVDLQIYFEEKQKELEYEAMQSMQLEQLKQQAERTIKPKGQNNPFNKKKTDNSSIPSLNNSQMSQVSSFDNLSERSTFKSTKQNGMKIANKNIPLETPHKQEISNPFLKKKSTEQDMNLKSKQIEDQIERFGVKKKAEINKRPKN